MKELNRKEPVLESAPKKTLNHEMLNHEPPDHVATAKKVSKQDCDHTCRGLMVSWLVWGRRGGLVTLAAVTLGSSCMVARPDVLVEDCAVGAVVCVLLAVSVAKVIDLWEGKNVWY